MNLSDSNTILQYRIAPTLLSLTQVANLCDALASVLDGSSSTCTLHCDEHLYSGTPAQFREQLQALEQQVVHSFSLNIVLPQQPQQQQQQIKQLQQQIQQIQQQIQQTQQLVQQQPAQRVQLRQQIQQLQQQQQQQQQQLTLLQQSAQVQLSLALNWLTETVTFTVSGQPLPAVRQRLSTQLDEAIKTIRSYVSPSDTAAVAYAGRLLGEMNAIAEKLPQARESAEQAFALIASVNDTLRRANDARSSVESIESEVAQLRRNAESERSKVNELREATIQAKSDLLQTLASAREAFTEMLATQKGRHSEILASHKENYTQIGDQLTDLKKQAAALVTVLTTNESSTSKLVAQSAELVQKLEKSTQDTASQVKTSVVEWESKFQTTLDECIKKRDQIHQLLGASVAANLSTTFRERQIALEKGRLAWLVCIFSLTAAIAGASYWIVDSTLNHAHASAALAWVLRVFIVLPLVLLDIFCIGQYKRKMILADQYAFKASIAASFDYYRDEIRVGFREGDRLAEFISQAVGRLWAEPNHTTELTSGQIKRLTKMLETLGVTALKEGSAVTQVALQSRGIRTGPPMQVKDNANTEIPAASRSNEVGQRN